MGVVKSAKGKTEGVVKNDLNGKAAKGDGKVRKKKKVSCLQCFKSPDDGEVECPIQQQQQYRYMNSEAGTLNRAKPLEDSVTDGHLWPSNNDKKEPWQDEAKMKCPQSQLRV
ncbi:unnamed protein product [Leptidea sinapis]|uniref:Uncharacterized protein n=1 Tax=Leptidea sinapis TaxID=189913 RepID=A0A5E4R6N2_9NEOP|nr:unnamed protein product [Leptidea sinapis]